MPRRVLRRSTRVTQRRGSRRARRCSTLRTPSPRRRSGSQTFDLEGLELPPGGGLEPFERQRPVAASVQVDNSIADSLGHPAHLPVAAFVDRQLDGGAVEPAYARGGGGTVVQRDAARQLLERSV